MASSNARWPEPSRGQRSKTRSRIMVSLGRWAPHRRANLYSCKAWYSEKKDTGYQVKIFAKIEWWKDTSSKNSHQPNIFQK
jgi:hypothetical protein